MCGADPGIDAADRALDLVLARMRTVREVVSLELTAQRDRCLRALERTMSAYEE